MKRQYIKPVSRVMSLKEDILVIPTSVPVDGNYVPGTGIGAKGHDSFWDNDYSWEDVYGFEQDNYELPQSKSLWD